MSNGRGYARPRISGAKKFRFQNTSEYKDAVIPTLKRSACLCEDDVHDGEYRVEHGRVLYEGLAEKTAALVKEVGMEEAGDLFLI